MLTERKVEDLQILQKYGRKDEQPFQAVEAVSDALASAYETFMHPVVAAISNPAAAKVARALNPQRAQRWALSDLNPFLWPLKGMADLVKANRAPRDNDGPTAMAERWAAAITSASGDLYRDLRDASVETAFLRTYTAASLVATPEDKVSSEERVDPKSAGPVKEALSHIEEGNRTAAIVRTALLLMKAGTGRRRLSAMKRTRELVGRDVGLLDLPGDVAREIIREQSYIVEFEPKQALAALPKLLPTREDRRLTLDLLDRLESKIEANPKQAALVGEIRHLLGRDGPITRPTDDRSAKLVKHDEVTHRARDTRRTRPSP
jgi:Protein of unknown function (DUF3141)